MPSPCFSVIRRPPRGLRGNSLLPPGWPWPFSSSPWGLTSPVVNSVFILFFFKEIPKNGNKVKNKNHYSDESGEQKKESSTGKKTTHRFLRETSPGRRGRRLFGLQGGRECACRPYRPCLPRAGRSTGSATEPTGASPRPHAP